MARKKKPCEFCENDYFESEALGLSEVCIEFYPENGLFSIHGFITPEDGETKEIELSYNFEYCPICGRKIGWN